MSRETKRKGDGLCVTSGGARIPTKNLYVGVTLHRDELSRTLSICRGASTELEGSPAHRWPRSFPRGWRQSQPPAASSCGAHTRINSLSYSIHGTALRNQKLPTESKGAAENVHLSPQHSTTHTDKQTHKHTRVGFRSRLARLSLWHSDTI